jgi:metal-sulfur cluster biosynthetic enzyme
VKDPEIPAINVLELGVVRGVEVPVHRSFETP